MNETIKGICIFGHYRTGSTLLCEQLANGINRKYKINAKPLYEILSPWATLTHSYTQLTIDYTGLMTRPFEYPIDLDRIEALAGKLNSDIFPVFKLMSTDITYTNRDAINKNVIHNRCIYKIFLNRYDVINQLLSFFISQVSGKWHAYNDTATEYTPIVPKNVNISYVKQIASGILLHYLRQFESAKNTFNKTVWYDELLSTEYNELGLSANDLAHCQTKINFDHVATAKMTIINFNEVYEIALGLEKNVNQMRALLRNE